MSSYVVPFARIEWTDSEPRSLDRGDIYFSKAGAIAEAEHVFIRGSQLEKKIREQRNITVGELGFGFGLNFILTWRAFEQSGSDGFLLYLSFENTPINEEDLRRFYLEYPELSDYASRLIEILPGNFSGSYRLSVTEQVSLQIVIGEATASLSQIPSGVVHTWYCDGFSPHVNAELWEGAMVQQVARLSVRGTSLASYSVAGQFRRELGECGFEVTKVPGFATKRESLTAVFGMGGSADVELRNRRISVLGGGIAGASVSRALARRGVQHSLFDRESEVGGGASGNLFGILMPHISLQPSPMADFFLAGFFTAIAEVSRLLREASVAGGLNGVLRLATSDRLIRLYEELERLNLPAEFISRMKLGSDGLFFGRGGYVAPRDLCQTMLNRSAGFVDYHAGTEVVDLERLENSWLLKHSNGEFTETDIVCLGQGYESLPFIAELNIPIEKVRGQVAVLNRREFSNEIRFPICYDGYITPAPSGNHLLGGTFDHNDEREESDDLQTDELLKRLEQNVPLCKFEPSDVIDSRVSFRAMTPDRLPIIGQLFQREEFEREFRAGGLRDLPLNSYLPGLFSLTGLGSKGLISAQLGAEIIVSNILNEPPPLFSRLLSAVNSGRFFARAIKRGEDV